jgi:glycosyltransferase involved in cell wall biosynthesis
MSALARHHEVSAVALASSSFDRESCERAMRRYCREVVLVPSPIERIGKRVAQLRSLFSRHTFEAHSFPLTEFQHALDAMLTKTTFDVVVVSAALFMHRCRLRQAPAGQPLPRMILDEHNIEFDLQRQMSKAGNIARRLHHAVNWRKARREEIFQWKSHDGVTFTSEPDLRRALEIVPSIRSAVVPNGVDVSAFEPHPSDPPPDGKTIMFFGINDYYPNTDGILFFLREVWPKLALSSPQARVKVVGPNPTPEILAQRSDRIEIAGKVDDLRHHLASAAVSIVPLRLGGGTRLKVLEAMSMAKPIVSTRVGAEGIDVVHEKHLLFADDSSSFAAAVGRVLADPELGARLGREGRTLAKERYSWEGVATKMEAFFDQVLGAPPRSPRVAEQASFADGH